MPRAAKILWTPEAEQAAAKMWNAYVDTTRIIMALKAEHGLVVKPTDLQALAKRKGGALNMIDGEERKRAPRGDRIENRTVRVRRGAVRKAMTQAKAETIEGTPFDQLQAGQCRYPLTKSLPHLFCNDKAVHGSWCAKHFEAIKGKKL
jgi:hypothetical protein